MSKTFKCDIAVLGGINTDYLIRGKRLPNPGEDLQGHEFQIAGELGAQAGIPDREAVMAFIKSRGESAATA